MILQAWSSVGVLLCELIIVAVSLRGVSNLMTETILNRQVMCKVVAETCSKKNLIAQQRNCLKVWIMS